jgi:tetratricopeptide (TPR) repeat protein
LGVPETGAERGRGADEDWAGHLAREQERYADGEARLPGAVDDDARQRQLTRLGNAATGAGLALLMLGRRDEAVGWFGRAAARYRESFAAAPPDSWGRPLGAMKALVLAGDPVGAKEAARWALDAGVADASSPIGRYAAALALLVLGEDDQARVHADAIRTRDDFPQDVGDALAVIGARDVVGYTEAIESVLASFAARDDYLEGLPVADTVVVLQSLARDRGLDVPLSSALLPPD